MNAGCCSPPDAKMPAQENPAGVVFLGLKVYGLTLPA